MQASKNIFSDVAFPSFFLLIVPGFLLGLLLLNFGVNVVYWDQWAIANTIVKAFEGQLTFSDLIVQHNESRKFFPRLIWIALAYLTNYDVRAEMLLSFLFACITSLNIFFLSKLTVDSRPIKVILLASIANFIIFSPIQYEAWFMGPSSVVFMSIACITACIVIASSRLNTQLKFLICGILSTISTFSFANGMLSWIVVFPVLTLSKNRKELVDKKWLYLGWLVSFAANAVFYFYNYEKPPTHPSFSETFVHPFQGVHYLLAFLGNQLAWGTGLNSLITAPTLGFFFVSIWVLLCIYFIKFFNDGNLQYRMMGWLMLGTYSLLSAFIATAGRSGFGVQQSLSSRYTTFSGYLLVAIIFLIAIIRTHAQTQRFNFKYKSIATKITIALLTILTILYFLNYAYSVQRMSAWQRIRLQGKTCLIFVNTAPDEECLKKLFPLGAKTIQPIANNLNNLGFLEPPLVTKNTLQDFKKATELGSINYGVFETLSKKDQNKYKVSGWAILPERGKAADSVILTYENGKGDHTVFKVIEVKGRSDKAVKAFKNLAYYYSGWRITFSLVGLPVGSLKINAWAFDTTTGKAFKLNGTHVIQNNPVQGIVPL